MRCYAGADCFLASWLQAPNSGSSSLRRSPTRESRDPTPPCTSSHPVCRGSVTEIGRNQRGPSRIEQKGREDREARQASPFRTSRPSCSNVSKGDRLGFAVPYLRVFAPSRDIWTVPPVATSARELNDLPSTRGRSRLQRKHRFLRPPGFLASGSSTDFVPRPRPAAGSPLPPIHPNSGISPSQQRLPPGKPEAEAKFLPFYEQLVRTSLPSRA